jgi:hypothetical protein
MGNESLDLFGEPIKQEPQAAKPGVYSLAPNSPAKEKEPRSCEASPHAQDCLYSPRPYEWWKESDYVTVIWNVA